MIVIIFFTSFFWALLLFIDWIEENQKAGLSVFIFWFLLNLLLGCVLYWMLAKFLYINAIVVLTGLVILISSFRWLEIWSKDLFSLFRRLNIMHLGTLLSSYSLYFTGLAAVTQANKGNFNWQGFEWILIINVLLAGFLLILFSIKRFFDKHRWLKTLIRIEAGIYLAIMGIVIMSRDIPFFVVKIEKILHS